MSWVATMPPTPRACRSPWEESSRLKPLLQGCAERESRSCRAGDARGVLAVVALASDAVSLRRPHPTSPASGGGAFVLCGKRLEGHDAIR